MITASHLTVYYGQHPALLDVSLKLQASQVVGLLGQNGAGKTTLLKTLARLNEPGSGHVEHHAACAFLPETPPVYGHLSVREHLEHCAHVQGIQRAQVPRRVAQAMEWGHLTDHADVLAGALSHGYTKRLGLAQCLLQPPEVLLLDEPLLGLDPTQVHHMKSLLADLAERGCAVVISSHMLRHVQDICQRALILHEGQLVADQPVEAPRQGTQRFQMSVQAHHDPQALVEALTQAGATDIEHDEEDQGLRARFLLEPQARARACRNVVEAGLGLTSMAACPTDLEALFLSLTAPQ